MKIILTSTLTIITFLFCLSCSILLTLINIPVYILSIYLFDITVLSTSELIVTYLELLKFLLLPAQTFHLSYFDISKSAVQHFYDVKVWLTINNVIMIVTGSICYLTRQYIQRQNLIVIKNTLKIIVMLLLLLGVMIVVNFNRVFIIFHEILFRGSYWQFDVVADRIILALPEQFFMLCFLQVIIYCIGLMYSYYYRIWRTK